MSDIYSVLIDGVPNLPTFLVLYSRLKPHGFPRDHHREDTKAVCAQAIADWVNVDAADRPRRLAALDQELKVMNLGVSVARLHPEAPVTETSPSPLTSRTDGPLTLTWKGDGKVEVEGRTVDLADLDPAVWTYKSTYSLQCRLDVHLNENDPGAGLGDALKAWGYALGERLRSPDRRSGLCVKGADKSALAWPWEAVQLWRGERLGLQAPVWCECDVPPEPKGESTRRLLLISPRSPLDTVSYRAVSEPMLEVMSAHGRGWEVEELRPATLKELRRRLKERRYDIVHFDGHGEEGGTLCFEGTQSPNHKPSTPLVDVDIDTFGSLLEHVRIVVLTACDSAREGAAPWAVSAAQVFARYVPAVVAMRWMLQGDAARRMVRPLVEALLKGKTVGEAVADARCELAADPLRYHGDAVYELEDWVVPSLLGKATQKVEQGEGERDFADRGLERTNPDWPWHIRNHACAGLPHGLVGREKDLHMLSKALGEGARGFVLHGAPGAGTTTLARWWILRMVQLGQVQGRVRDFQRGSAEAAVKAWLKELGKGTSGDLSVLLERLATNLCEGDLLFWDDAPADELAKLCELIRHDQFIARRCLLVATSSEGVNGLISQPLSALGSEAALTLIARYARASKVEVSAERREELVSLLPSALLEALQTLPTAPAASAPAAPAPPAASPRHPKLGRAAWLAGLLDSPEGDLGQVTNTALLQRLEDALTR